MNEKVADAVAASHPDRPSAHCNCRIVDWFEKAVLRATLNESAHRDEPGFLFFDEVQNLATWDVQLKSLVDHATVRAMVTGSSALGIEKGRDSLAGRIHSLEVGPLRLAEIAVLRGFGSLRPLQTENGWQDWLLADFWRELVIHGQSQRKVLTSAFAAFSARGAYPMAQANVEVPWEDIAVQLNETIVKRVIEHDLRVGERGRKRDRLLLEEVFRMGCRYIGQSPTPATLAEEARRTLNANIGPQRIRHYLDFLDSSLLLRTIEPLEIRLKKRRGYSKLEIKYRRTIDPVRDTLGLRAFIEKAGNNATFGLLIVRDDAPAVADPRIVTVPLPALLILR